MLGPQETAHAIAVARQLAANGIPVFVARPATDDAGSWEPFSTYLDWEAAADPWLFIAVFCRNDAERAANARDIKEARK